MGYTRELALIAVKTFEDIHTSSGLLSANSTLMDVAQRIAEAGLGAALIRLVGGPTVVVLLTRPVLPTVPETESSELPASTADKLRNIVESGAYALEVIEISLRFFVASMRVGTGQSALHAIGQADHVLIA